MRKISYRISELLVTITDSNSTKKLATLYCSVCTNGKGDSYINVDDCKRVSNGGPELTDDEVESIREDLSRDLNLNP